MAKVLKAKTPKSKVKETAKKEVVETPVEEVEEVNEAVEVEEVKQPSTDEISETDSGLYSVKLDNKKYDDFTSEQVTSLVGAMLGKAKRIIIDKQ